MEHDLDPRFTFCIAKAPYLIALGDDTELLVYRSLAVSKFSEAYREVTQYISGMRLVMVSTVELTRHDGMAGRVEMTRYATPEARELIYATADGPVTPYRGLHAAQSVVGTELPLDSSSSSG